MKPYVVASYSQSSSPHIVEFLGWGEKDPGGEGYEGKGGLVGG